MASRYINIRDTWDGACVTMLVGAVYNALVGVLLLALLWKGSSGSSASLSTLIPVFGISMVLSVPFLLVGSATVMWWMAQYIGNRVEKNRLLVFAMAGLLLGVLGDVVVIAWILAAQMDTPTHLPTTPREWMAVALMATVLPFYTLVAGIVAGVRWAQLEAKQQQVGI